MGDERTERGRSMGGFLSNVRAPWLLVLELCRIGIWPERYSMFTLACWHCQSVVAAPKKQRSL